MKNKAITEIVILSSILAFTAFIWLSPKGIAAAPNIELTTLKGKTINPATLANKPTLVTFWATSCATCMQEVPEFKKMHFEYHPLGLNIIAVAMYYDRPDRVSEVVKQKQMPYHIVIDIEKKAMQAFKMKRALTPTTYLISPSGRIVFHKVGKISMKRLRRKIELMLAQGKSKNTHKLN